MTTDYIKLFMDEHLAIYSENTLKSYASDLMKFAEWFEQTNNEPFSPSGLTQRDVLEYFQFLTTVDTQRARTFNRRLASLKTFIGWCRDNNLLEGDYRFPKQSPYEISSSIQWLTKKEQHALLRSAEKAKNPRNLAIIQILLNTGLRVGELCDLKWDDIKITQRQGQLLVRKGKRRKERFVPLNVEARKAFLSLKSIENGDFVLKSQRNPQLSPRGVQFLLKNLIKTVPSLRDDISVHSLRHTFCKNLIDSGVNIEVVAELAGHKNLNTTRLYCKPGQKDLEAAVSRLAFE